MLRVGEVYMTAGVKECLANRKDQTDKVDEVTAALRRHITCDWGDISEFDKKANDDAMKNSDQILSAYNMSFGRIWIITEHDRKTTTILFPEEY